MSERPIVIAIDGPAASGKGTIAKAIAKHFDLPHLDTGLLYRATAFAMRKKGKSPDDIAAGVAAAKALTPADLHNEGLRGRHVGEAASVIAAISKVREALVHMQRVFANGEKGAVLDGRDIGTYICPDADVKLFVTASPEERAKRRTMELRARGEDAPFDEVLADIIRRDERDSHRSTAPLKMADDAELLDTTKLDAEKSIAAAIAMVNRALHNRT